VFAPCPLGVCPPWCLPPCPPKGGFVLTGVCPPAPLKGGSSSNWNKFFLKNENEPPFRGVGGPKTRKREEVEGQKRNKEMLTLYNETKTGRYNSAKDPNSRWGYGDYDPKTQATGE